MHFVWCLVQIVWYRVSGACSVWWRLSGAFLVHIVWYRMSGAFSACYRLFLVQTFCDAYCLVSISDFLVQIVCCIYHPVQIVWCRLCLVQIVFGDVLWCRLCLVQTWSGLGGAGAVRRRPPPELQRWVLFAQPGCSYAARKGYFWSVGSLV